MSRIYGGIHYSIDNVAGQAAGNSVAQLVMPSYFNLSRRFGVLVWSAVAKPQLSRC